MQTLQKTGSIEFEKVGFLNPERLLQPNEAHALVGRLRKPDSPPTQNRPSQAHLQWFKSNAATSPVFFEIATDKRILDKLVPLLGNNIMLWGAQLIRREPGRAHPWHTDMESWTAGGKLVNVWIALQNVGNDSRLRVISGSQNLGVTVQQLRSESETERSELRDEDIVAWAKARNEDSELIAFEMTDGDAIIFDGRIWHGSQNFSDSTRLALLLQYATPDSIIRIPDPIQVDWPFRYSEERPPCLIVHGEDTAGVNRIVPAPDERRDWCDPLSSRGVPLQLPLSSKVTDSDWSSCTPSNKNELGWTPHPILGGATKTLNRFRAHAAVLRHDCCPHPPHRHRNEELLIVLNGEVEINLPDLEESAQRQRLVKGDFVYYPCNFAHTVTATSQPSATYLMFKWEQKEDKDRDQPTLPFGKYNFLDQTASGKVVTKHAGFSYDKHFEGPTAHLEKIHCHYSTQTPGGGYEPHVDPYDVILVILEGQVETLGETYGPHSVIFYAAGEPHGLRNRGVVDAKYLVFEFHGERRGAQKESKGKGTPTPPPAKRSLASKLVDPQCWKRLIMSVLKTK